MKKLDQRYVSGLNPLSAQKDSKYGHTRAMLPLCKSARGVPSIFFLELEVIRAIFRANKEVLAAPFAGY